MSCSRVTPKTLPYFCYGHILVQLVKILCVMFGWPVVSFESYWHKLAENVKKNKNYVGILICGSGTGMSIAANKHRNIRAAQCFSLKSTKLSRLHNDANVITLGSRLISKNEAMKFISAFLNTKFEGGRHLRRVKKI